jgi:hypothetical protein
LFRKRRRRSFSRRLAFFAASFASFSASGEGVAAPFAPESSSERGKVDGRAAAAVGGATGGATGGTGGATGGDVSAVAIAAAAPAAPKRFAAKNAEFGLDGVRSRSYSRALGDVLDTQCAFGDPTLSPSSSTSSASSIFRRDATATAGGV